MAGEDASCVDLSLAPIVEQLLCRATQVKADDLPVLAQMHEWCQTITVQSQGTATAGISELANELRARLECLILGQVEDAVAAMQSIADDVLRLAELVHGETATLDAQPDEVMSGLVPAKCNDHETAEALSRIFDEPAAAEPDLPAPSDPAISDHKAAAQPEPEAYEPTPLLIVAKEHDFVKSFVEEACEHVEAIEAAVLGVERAPTDNDKINDLFRPFHTIKGMAGFLNLRDINCLAHEVETLMDQARKGERAVTPGLIDLVFDVVDVLKAQIAAIAEYLSAPTGQAVPQPEITGMIGNLRAVVLRQIEPQARTPLPTRSDQKIGEKLVAQGAVAPEVVDFALSKQRESGGAQKTGEILMDMGVTTPRQVSQALRTPTTTSPAPVADQSVRIDTTKLDALVDMVGELVIAQTLVSGSDAILGEARLCKNVGQVTKIVRTVQEVVLSMRMIPIGSTFQKMARLVRDVSRKAGKQVELTISGEDTELDKNVIQQISDPLVHMVRNAVDHGVESPEERIAAGKTELGSVHLGASHEGGNIVIEITDDGKGLDPQKLLKKAIEKGIVSPENELTEQQIYGLIFEPGFSTAEQITDISGRGVGMDVVRRNIDQLRGKIDIQSEKGKGTSFHIRLPLTLAIIDGMVVRVARERFIIPTIALEQALRPQPQQITTVQHRGEMIQVRGQLIPLIQLGELFSLTGWIDPSHAMVVIAQCDGKSVGVVVEELMGQQQVVIKSLGERFRRLRGISGGAILGDGRVGLILEMSGLGAQHAVLKPTSRRERGMPCVTSDSSAASSEPVLGAVA